MDKPVTQDVWSRRKVLGAIATTPFAAYGLYTYLQSATAPTPIVEEVVKPKGLIIPGTTPFESYRGYSNAYEFGTSKSSPAAKEHTLVTEGWTVNVDGKIMDLDTIRGVPFNQLQEKVFNFRCVEAWGMKVHYNGYPLSEFIKKYGDTTKKYVAFTCVEQEGLPGQGFFSSLNWPYTEAITMEEAMNPLTWMVFGNYGVASVANGAPLRVNMPWKYGFKSPKFVVGIAFTDTMPPATWNRVSQSEYGWYSNVYPTINHPRWSQATHRQIGEDGSTNRIPTLRYNGYEEQVAHLYPLTDNNYR